jgi:hypothetical protein
VLFSDEKIAKFVNDNFEATWHSVRSVPIVRIDFGNGQVLTRTLHGNIATYICRGDGTVLDILPGIYNSRTYQQRLAQLVLLHAWTQQDKENRIANLKEYHLRGAEALGKGEAAPIVAPVIDVRKSAIEVGARWVLRPPVNAEVASKTSRATPTRIDSPEDVRTWKALADDTRINESVRRRMIHEHLAGKESIAPSDITKWLYREVLHADLDDPYLGLGDVLFANYPFAAEDLK